MSVNCGVYEHVSVPRTTIGMLDACLGYTADVISYRASTVGMLDASLGYTADVISYYSRFFL